MFARIGNPVYLILIISLGNSSGSPSIIGAPKNSVDLEVIEDSKSQEVTIVKFNKELPQLTSLKYGQHLKLICDVELLAGMQVGWYMQAKELARSSSPELDFTMDIIHKGQYITCDAIQNNEVVQTFGTIFALDLGPPLNNDKAENITIIAGNTLTLSCKNNGTALPPPVKWHIKKLNAQYEDLNKTGDVFDITNATLSDAGEYKCNYSANCNCESRKTFVVSVQMEPVVVIEQGSNSTHSYGDDVEFSCKVEGYPLPKVVWKDNNGTQVVATSTIENAHTKISRLKINRIKVPNNYTCHANNSLGQAETSINITIKSPFTVHEIPSPEIYVANRTSSDVVCNITATFPMEIIWFYQNANTSDLHEIHTHGDYKISGDNNIALKIVSMKNELAGKYTCKARLKADKDESEEFSFDVKLGDPVPPTVSSRKLALLENCSAILFCNVVNGAPPPTLSWHFLSVGGTAMIDLNATSEEYQLNRVSVSDSGIYQCVAKNPSGEIEALTEVDVRKSFEETASVG